VAAEFIMEARELITAPATAANMNPRIPTGTRFLMRVGKAASGLPNRPA